MTQQIRAATPVVYLDAKKNLDKDIDLARFGARKDHVTVILQRVFTTQKGNLRRTPILEITPKGDLLEILAPRLRTPIHEHLADADIAFRLGDMNRARAEGHLHFATLVKVSRDFLAAKRDWEASEANQKQPKGSFEREARRNKNTTTMLSQRAARKDADPEKGAA